MLWDVRLSTDPRLDLHIGALELYRLHGWYGEKVVYLHFLPMSLHRIRSIVQEGLDEEAIVAHPEAHPQLCRDDVEVLVDGELCSVRTFAEHPDFLSVKDGRRVSRPGYILSIDKDSVASAKTKVICVRARHRLERDDRRVVEEGEAHFLGFHGRPESRST